MGGWVKVHRDFFSSWEWAADPNTVAVWIRLLVDARYEPGAYRGTPLEAGQVIVGRKALAEKTGLTERQVRTALEHLEQSGVISRKSTNKFSIVTLEKWEVEQSLQDVADQQDGQQPVRPASGNRPATDHVRKREKGKKERRKNAVEPRTAHGPYANVLLTADQLSTFQSEYPADWPRFIEELSGYMASTGKKYANHLATLRNWARRDVKPTGNHVPLARQTDLDHLF